jgi:hypothetical protein
MRKSWAFHLAAPMACATLMLGCDRRDENRAEQASATAEKPAEATVALTGCVEAAPGTNQYVLRQVRFDGNRPVNPHNTTTTSGAHGITEGSWVRLDASDQDLRSRLGQRVLITGAITDDGRNTIGTAGTSGSATPSGDASQAASRGHHSEKVKDEAGRIGRESMADGTAAEVRVKQVQGTGEKCEQVNK